jgi:predicted nucleotide-binding protein (sugar kinase/HSP70/actin superfamily)
MSVGAMAGVIGRHPDLLYAPLEIKGDAEVHALSRCQMILTEAKKRAQKEWEQTLARVKMSEAEVRDAVKPHMKKATFKVPRPGLAAGTAANVALHVAGVTA